MANPVRSAMDIKELKKEWFPNGQLRRVFYVINGKQQGEFKEFDEQGKIKISGTYKDGKLNGSYKETVDDILKEFNYKNGKQHGWQTEYVNGRLSKKYHCHLGSLAGHFFTYSPNGINLIACHFEENELEGKYSQFYHSSKPLLMGNFKKGKKHGEFIKYAEDSQYIVAYFSKDEPVKTWCECESDGTVKKQFKGTLFLAKALFEISKTSINK